jgi:hypothetical protein
MLVVLHGEHSVLDGSGYCRYGGPKPVFNTTRFRESVPALAKLAERSL